LNGGEYQNQIYDVEFAIHAAQQDALTYAEQYRQAHERAEERLSTRDGNKTSSLSLQRSIGSARPSQPTSGRYTAWTTTPNLRQASGGKESPRQE
uniref:Secretion protein HlyD n=1 Tax=Haemonchus placei TaxID=6290 RepID=A0A0N4VV04_HAEPC